MALAVLPGHPFLTKQLLRGPPDCCLDCQLYRLSPTVFDECYCWFWPRQQWQSVCSSKTVNEWCIYNLGHCCKGSGKCLKGNVYFSQSRLALLWALECTGQPLAVWASLINDCKLDKTIQSEIKWNTLLVLLVLLLQGHMTLLYISDCVFRFCFPSALSITVLDIKQRNSFVHCYGELSYAVISKCEDLDLFHCEQIVLTTVLLRIVFMQQNKQNYFL